MVETKDKLGQTIYITYIEDCGDNEDGFYCETYADENFDRKIDDFVIRPGDIRGFRKMSENERYEAVRKYCQRYYRNVELDLNWSFTLGRHIDNWDEDEEE